MSANERGKVMLWQIKKILCEHFPDLQERLSKVSDPRTGVWYKVEELLMGGCMLFILKCDSRNELNYKYNDEQFCKNYYRMFRLNFPHMDAVNDLLIKLSDEELAEIRCRLIGRLIEKRVFHKFRFWGKCFYIAIDGTGVYNWGNKPHKELLPYALKRESGKESGKVKTTTYYGQVLEAVLICTNGMSIPLISEWIANDGQEYDKQDCELKAFKRLAVKLKKYFPRLDICILADGLYSNAPFMDICRDNDWKYITVFRDGNLPSVWQEVENLLPITTANRHQQYFRDSTHRITRNYQWIKDIDYDKRSVHWMRCVQESVHLQTGEIKNNRFVFITNMDVSVQNIVSLLMAGRARWFIEDHFNTQKNRGGNLHHKFSRNDFNAIKNWHNLRQLVCIFNELVKHTQELMSLMKENTKMTLKELWKNLNSYLLNCVCGDIEEFEQWSKSRRQVRLE